MNTLFTTNVFVRGAAAFYSVAAIGDGVYKLTLQFCRLQVNPPPGELLIRLNADGDWDCINRIPNEFLFIAAHIGKRIKEPFPIIPAPQKNVSL